MTIKCKPSGLPIPTRNEYLKLRKGNPLEKFRQSKIRKHLVLAAPRTMGTAIGRNIAHQDGTAQNTSIFLDEATTRTFSDAFAVLKTPRRQISPIPNDTTVSRFTHNVVAHHANTLIEKSKEDIGNITLHEYPASAIVMNNNYEDIDISQTKEFLSSFDTISLTLRAPHKAITSLLKGHFEETLYRDKKTKKAEFDLADLPEKNIKFALSQYIEEIGALLYIADMVDQDASLSNTSITAINVDKLDGDAVKEINAHPAPGDNHAGMEYIESYGIASPDNPFKKNSLKPEWAGITPHAVSQQSNEDNLSPQLSEELLTDFRTCQTAYRALKEKLISMSNRGKIKYIGTKE